MVEGGDVVNGEDLGGSDVTEHRNFGGDGERKRARTSTGDLRCMTGQLGPREGDEIAHEVGSESKSSQISNTGLSRFRFEFSVDRRDERDVDEGEVVGADAELELSHRLDERCGFDISNGSTQLRNSSELVHSGDAATHLDDADVGSDSRAVDGHLGDPLNPILNRIRDVRNDLHRLAQVISSTLFSRVLRHSSALPNRPLLTSRSMTC